MDDIKIERKITNVELIDMWNSLKSMINEEVATSAADEAFLMETMSDLANRYKPNAKDAYKIKLPYKKWVAIWHSINVTVSNEFVKNEAKVSSLCQTMSVLAAMLDQSTVSHPEVNNSKSLILE